MGWACSKKGRRMRAEESCGKDFRRKMTLWKITTDCEIGSRLKWRRLVLQKKMQVIGPAGGSMLMRLNIKSDKMVRRVKVNLEFQRADFYNWRVIANHYRHMFLSNYESRPFLRGVKNVFHIAKNLFLTLRQML